MNVELIATDRLRVSAIHERPSTPTEDKALRNSIKAGGVQQPLTLLRVGDDLRVVKGGRRLRMAKELGLPKVPCTIEEAPKGEDPELYAVKLRFQLDHHRQDLLPLVRAQMLEELRTKHGLTVSQIADYLGIVPESVRNWLDPLTYIEEVQHLLNVGTINLNGARVFVGLTEHGQRWILKHHLDELTGAGGKDGLAQKLRKQYPPAKFPQFYVNPKATERNLELAKNRRVAVRSRVANTSAADKKKLLNTVEMKQAQIDQNKEDLKEMKEGIRAAVPIVSAIVRNKKLQEAIPEQYREEMMEEFRRFAEEHC